MDRAKSIIAKLKNKSATTGKPLQLHLQLFCQEELLRRISLSRYVDNLVLKGGLFIYTLTNFESRATIDIDFLLRDFPSTIEDIKRIIVEIINIETKQDYVVFEILSFSEINPLRKYKGTSIQLLGRIGNTRTPINVDFGIGDVIVPSSEMRNIPTQLDKFDSPKINTYSLESVIAEKVDAMIQRYELTSRMKDLFDIYYLANTFVFEGEKLQTALIQTLDNRGTNYQKNSLERIMKFSENQEMLKKWSAFLRKQKISEPSLTRVIEVIGQFIQELYNCSFDETEFIGIWNPDTLNWD